MKGKFGSITEFLDYFSTEVLCAKHLEETRWGGKTTCPHCGSSDPYRTSQGFKCSSRVCLRKFTVRTNTIFQNSKLPLRKWYLAIYLCLTSKKGISSTQLAVQVGVTQKTAWFMLHRIRSMLKEEAPEMLGGDEAVEGDATYIGGKEKNRHYPKKRNKSDPKLANDGTRYNEKKVVIGLVERGGRVVCKHVSTENKENMEAFVHFNVPRGSRLYTDDFSGYKELSRNYKHGSICHSKRHFVDRDVHTNTIESFWALLKRGITGVYHHVSAKHLHRYLDEFCARQNIRHLTVTARFNQFMSSPKSPLPYRVLISEC